jgi:hypothetical protein
MSKCYKFSTRGKIENTLRVTIFFGLIVVGLIFLGRISFLKYIVWLPLLWIIVQLFRRIIHFWTTTFEMDNESLLMISGFNAVTKIHWRDIRKVKHYQHGSISIFLKEEKRPWFLEDNIENYEELFKAIISKAKDAGAEID